MIRMDIIYFDDGSRIQRREGKIENIAEGFVNFRSDKGLELISSFRVIRIERRDAYQKP